MNTWTKTYICDARRTVAAAHYRWLRGLSLRIPELVSESPSEMVFSCVEGRHAELRDLELLAEHLGRMHATAYWRELYRARLDRAYVTASGLRIASFGERRLEAIRRQLQLGVPEPQFDYAMIVRLFAESATAPAALYKDTNLRNILITSNGPVTVDFDDLTLAPFGYDLAKLIVTLSMTHGRISTIVIRAALETYNAAIREIATVSWRELIIWTEFHHILTNPYVGRNGYRISWYQLRPAMDATVI